MLPRLVVLCMLTVFVEALLMMLTTLVMPASFAAMLCTMHNAPRHRCNAQCTMHNAPKHNAQCKMHHAQYSKAMRNAPRPQCNAPCNAPMHNAPCQHNVLLQTRCAPRAHVARHDALDSTNFGDSLLLQQRWNSCHSSRSRVTIAIRTGRARSAQKHPFSRDGIPVTPPDRLRQPTQRNPSRS